jgi:hypothetical protein
LALLAVVLCTTSFFVMEAFRSQFGTSRMPQWTGARELLQSSRHRAGYIGHKSARGSQRTRLTVRPLAACRVPFAQIQKYFLRNPLVEPVQTVGRRLNPLHKRACGDLFRLEKSPAAARGSLCFA